MTLLSRLRRALPRPRITIARWIALTTLTAMFILLLLKGLFSLLLSVWAQPPLLESGVIEKVAAVTRILDTAPVAQRPGIASAAGDGSYSVQWLRSRDQAGIPELVDAEFRQGAPTLRALLKRPHARIQAFEASEPWEFEPARGYALMIELSDKLDAPRRCVYVGRPVGIKRVLVNLVDNAVKYGLAPELRLAVTAEQLEITVLDRGPGIAPELQERVFAPFSASKVRAIVTPVVPASACRRYARSCWSKAAV
jgi:hypothetical protein